MATDATKQTPQFQLPTGYEDAQKVAQTDPHECVPTLIYPLTDTGNAERFAFRYGGEFVYTEATGWMVYRNGVWKRDTTDEVDYAMVRTIRRIVLEAQLVDTLDKFSSWTDDEKEGYKAQIAAWGSKCEADSKVKAAMNRAAADPVFSRDYSAFDRKDWYFNCANGTVNLRTMNFVQHDPAHLLTKQSPIAFDPNADCPKFRQFLLDIMGGKPHLRAYLMRCLGYTISSETGEQCMFIPWGTQGTGKSTFLNIVRGVMGDYAVSADAEMFMVKHGDAGQPFEFAGKDGVRMLMAVETEEGKKFAMARIKRMTGSDPVVACYKFKMQYEFTPQWKLWLATNDRPEVRAGDDAAWIRLKPIPFEVTFRGTEKQIKDFDKLLLTEEGSGILNYMLAGYQQWKKTGLQHPEEVAKAVADWHEREDWLARFVEEKLEHADLPSEFVKKSELFSSFQRWSEITREGRGMDEKKFTEAMRRKGYDDDVVKVGGKATRVWKNLKLQSVTYTVSENVVKAFEDGV